MNNAWKIFKANQRVFLQTNLTPFANCTPYKTELDVPTAYQKYLCDDKWDESSKWTRRDKPWFYREPVIKLGIEGI